MKKHLLIALGALFIISCQKDYDDQFDEVAAAEEIAIVSSDSVSAGAGIAGKGSAAKKQLPGVLGTAYGQRFATATNVSQQRRSMFIKEKSRQPFHVKGESIFFLSQDGEYVEGGVAWNGGHYFFLGQADGHLPAEGDLISIGAEFYGKMPFLVKGDIDREGKVYVNAAGLATVKKGDQLSIETAEGILLAKAFAVNKKAGYIHLSTLGGKSLNFNVYDGTLMRQDDGYYPNQPDVSKNIVIGGVGADFGYTSTNSGLKRGDIVEGKNGVTYKVMNSDAASVRLSWIYDNKPIKGSSLPRIITKKEGEDFIISTGYTVPGPYDTHAPIWFEEAGSVAFFDGDKVNMYDGSGKNAVKQFLVAGYFEGRLLIKNLDGTPFSEEIQAGTKFKKADGPIEIPPVAWEALYEVLSLDGNNIHFGRANIGPSSIKVGNKITYSVLEDTGYYQWREAYIVSVDGFHAVINNAPSHCEAELVDPPIVGKSVFIQRPIKAIAECAPEEVPDATVGGYEDGQVILSPIASSSKGGAGIVSKGSLNIQLGDRVKYYDTRSSADAVRTEHFAYIVGINGNKVKLSEVNQECGAQLVPSKEPALDAKIYLVDGALEADACEDLQPVLPSIIIDYSAPSAEISDIALHSGGTSGKLKAVINGENGWSRISDLDRYYYEGSNGDVKEFVIFGIFTDGSAQVAGDVSELVAGVRIYKVVYLNNIYAQWTKATGRDLLVTNYFAPPTTTAAAGDLYQFNQNGKTHYLIYKSDASDYYSQGYNFRMLGEVPEYGTIIKRSYGNAAPPVVAITLEGVDPIVEGDTVFVSSRRLNGENADLVLVGDEFTYSGGTAKLHTVRWEPIRKISTGVVHWTKKFHFTFEGSIPGIGENEVFTLK